MNKFLGSFALFIMTFLGFVTVAHAVVAPNPLPIPENNCVGRLTAGTAAAIGADFDNDIGYILTTSHIEQWVHTQEEGASNPSVFILCQDESCSSSNSNIYRAIKELEAPWPSSWGLSNISIYEVELNANNRDQWTWCPLAEEAAATSDLLVVAGIGKTKGALLPSGSAGAPYGGYRVSNQRKLVYGQNKTSFSGVLHTTFGHVDGRCALDNNPPAHEATVVDNDSGAPLFKQDAQGILRIVGVTQTASNPNMAAYCISSGGFTNLLEVDLDPTEQFETRKAWIESLHESINTLPPEDNEQEITRCSQILDNGGVEASDPLLVADWNEDGFKNDSDFFGFVNDFFDAAQGHDFNCDSYSNDQDWFSFINGFFTN